VFAVIYLGRAPVSAKKWWEKHAGALGVGAAVSSASLEDKTMDQLFSAVRLILYYRMVSAHKDVIGSHAW
jgi:hypothetical protein